MTDICEEIRKILTIDDVRYLVDKYRKINRATENLEKALDIARKEGYELRDVLHIATLCEGIEKEKMTKILELNTKIQNGIVQEILVNERLGNEIDDILQLRNFRYFIYNVSNIMGVTLSELEEKWECKKNSLHNLCSNGEIDIETYQNIVRLFGALKEWEMYIKYPQKYNLLGGYHE